MHTFYIAINLGILSPYAMLYRYGIACYSDTDKKQHFFYFKIILIEQNNIWQQNNVKLNKTELTKKGQTKCINKIYMYVWNRQQRHKTIRKKKWTFNSQEC